MQIDIRQVVLAIGNAVDLVGVNDVLHGRRVAVMAVECTRQLGWDEARQHFIFDVGVLHDCGVSSTRVHSCLVKQLDWEGSDAHCQQGYQLLQRYAPLAHLAPVIRHHHTHWEDLVSAGIDRDTALAANLIYLVDRVDACACPHYADDTLLQHVAEIRELIAQHRGTFFAPELVDGFLEVSRLEAFWLLLNAEFLGHYVAMKERATATRNLSVAEIKQFGIIVATIVDAKSPFTADHSFGVARLSRRLGEWAGFGGERLDRIEIAGLLHDIGKLQIPDEILESPTRFTPHERLLMRKHSYVTWQILTRIEGLDEIAFWAAAHHESLNGEGYPFHYGAKDLPMEARVIKVADVFHALAQKRPYRNPAPVEEIVAHLIELRDANEVDGSLVALVASKAQEFYALAQEVGAGVRGNDP